MSAAALALAVLHALAGAPAPVPAPTGTPAAAAPVRAPADPRAELRRIAPELLRRYHVPGLAVALVRGRRLAWVEGFGVQRAGSPRPVAADTVFEAASLSKPLFAWAVLRQVVAGRLALDKPLDSYLATPYLPGDPRAARITALQVLDHTTGLPNWPAGGKPLATEFEPGSRWQYSGAGYNYLQHVVERQTGQPLDQLMRQAALDPLGMTASSYVWRAAYETAAAAPHDRQGRPLPKDRPGQASAASSLHATAADYGRFLAAMLDPAAHAALLPPAAAGSMLVQRVAVDPRLGLGWGLGWALETWQGSRCFFHWGVNDGFRAFVLGNPMTGDGFVAFTNGAAGLDMMDQLTRTLDGNAHPLFGFRLLHPDD